MTRYIWAIAFFAIVTSCANNKPDYTVALHDPVLYSKITGQLTDVMTYDIFTPPVASRIYAYAHLAAYEVIAASDSDYLSLQGQLNGFSGVPKPEAGKEIDFPYASMIALMEVGRNLTFSKDQTDKIIDSLKELAEETGMPEEMKKNSEEYGVNVGKAIMAWSKKDNYAETRSAAKYTVPNEEGLWVPTPPAYIQAVEPQWKTIRTIALDSASEFEPPPPVKYSREEGSEFNAWVNQVYDSVSQLTDEQKEIANFWDCNGFKMNVIGHTMFATKAMTPGGHWMGITGIISKNEKAGFAKTVYAYTSVAFGIMDGFISSWSAKYSWNLVRPETVINKYMDPDWKPFLQTPPFPEYTSAHSTISGAAATILENIYGPVAYKDSTERPWGWPDRSFDRPLTAAREAAISRFYGGIHYRYSCLVGSETGISVGKKVLSKLKMRKEQLADN